MTQNDIQRRYLQQQHKYHNIFENAPIGILYFDTKSNITDVNTRATEIFGHSKEEFLGFNLLDNLVDEPLKDAVSRVLTLGDGAYEGFYQPLNGHSASHLYIILKALYNEAGIIASAIGLVQDITAEKEAKEALGHYMHIVDATKDMIAYIDRDFRYIAVNRSYLDFHHKGKGNIINYKVSDIVGEDNFATIRPLLERALQGEQFSVKNSYQHPNDETFIYDNIIEEGHFSPHINEDEKITGVVVSIRDITEQELTKEKAHRYAKQAKRYFEIMPVMVLALDHAANIIQINQKGCEILGYDKKELLGKNWIDTCIPEELRDEIDLVFSQVIEHEEDFPLYHENSVITKNADKRHIAWKNVTIRDKEGKIIEVLSVGEDITHGRSDKI